QHGDLAGELQRIVEGRHHRAGDQPHLSGTRGRRRQEHDRVRAIAAIALEIMLNRARVAIAERVGLLGDGEALGEILRGVFVAWPEIRKELNAELHPVHSAACWKISMSSGRSRSTTLPSLITQARFLVSCKIAISAIGSFSHTVTSASWPAASWPTWPSRPT